MSSRAPFPCCLRAVRLCTGSYLRLLGEPAVTCRPPQRWQTFRTVENGGRVHYSFDPSIFPELHAHNDRLNRVLTELDKTVARYKWHPKIWTLGYHDSPFFLGTDWKARNADEHWENYSVWFLCSQRNGELLDYFRRCRECNKWLFAVTPHQIYCSDKCRKRFASRSEEFRNARREYMRNYRKQEESRDRAAKDRLELRKRSR